jgi:Ni/Co efflux regulator RcnB
MRKALMGLILAATVMTPIAAEAQRDRGGRGERSSNSNRGGGESRAERIEQRNQARQTNSDAPPPQAEPQQAPPAPVVQRQRGGDGGNRNNWRGGDNNNNDGNRGDRGNRGDWNRGDNGNRGGRGDRGNQPSIYPQTWQGNPNDPQLRHYQELERRNQQQYRRGGDRRNDGRDWRNDRRDDRRDWRGDRRGDRRGDWNRGWRNDRRYDWQGWRNSNRNIFRGSRYYSPYRNHRYSRFSIGFFLEPLFFSQNYWIGDPWQYRLPPAPYGTQWVRYYDDVLLVDVETGEVLDTIYDFFW